MKKTRRPHAAVQGVRTGFRLSVLRRSTAMFAALCTAGTLQAQPRVQPIDLPAQSLDRSLAALAQQSGVRIGFAADALRGQAALAVKGELSPQDALTQLLAGTSWRVMKAADGGYDVVPAAAAGTDSADGPTLAPITVSANSVAGAPPVYAGGQVARAARLGILGNVNVMDAPFSVTAYTAKTIEDQQARTVADVLINDPGIRQGSPSTYGLEFYQARSFTLYGYDISMSGMYGVLPYGRIPVEIAERVELLRGPTGMLYGQSPSGAVGGGINIVPKRAEDDPVTRLTTGYASDSQGSAAVDIGRRFGDRNQWGIRVNGAASSGDSGIDGQSVRRHLGALALDYRGDRVRFSLDAYDTRYRTNGGAGAFALFSTAVVPAVPKTSTNLFPGTFHDNYDAGGVVRGEVDIADNLTAYVGLGQRHHYDIGYLASAARNVSASGGFSGQLYPGVSYNDTHAAEMGLRGNFRTGPVRHDWNIGGNTLDIHAGASTSRGTPAYTSNIYAPTQMRLTTADYPALPTSDTKLQSIAIADTMSFAEDRVKLTLGARQQRVSVRGYSPLSSNLNSPQSLLVYQSSRYAADAVTPMVGLVVKPVANLSLYANYIEGLTSGSQVTDRLASNYGTVFPPMKTKQAEIGAKWDLGTWTHTVALYEIKKPSLINVYTGSSYAVDGSGEQRNRGLEWTTFGEVARGVRLLGGAAFTDAKLTRTARGVNQGNTAFASPKWKLNLGAEWDVPGVPGLTLTALAVHNSWQWLNSANTQRIGAWTRYDLGARYVTELSGKPVTLRASVQNVTNKAYWDAGFRDGLATLSAPRTFLLSATFDL